MSARDPHSSCQTYLGLEHNRQAVYGPGLPPDSAGESQLGFAAGPHQGPRESGVTDVEFEEDEAPLT